ncbi:cytochrome P450 [Streptomyces microflavus]|uniref:cytochrome P450 n=1 Tax=Streptomyces microflavus TaxID=1919 RepID=UPI0037F43E98
MIEITKEGKVEDSTPISDDIAFVTGRAPGAWPILGHAIPLLRDPLGFLRRLPAYGDLVELKIGWWRAYIACHPKLVTQVLLDDRTFDKGGPIVERGREFVGNGLATCPHSEHRHQRRLIQPAFHKDRLPAHTAVMSDQIDKVTDSWRDGQMIIPAEEMRLLTGSVLTATLFGSALRPEEISEVTRSINTIMSSVFRNMILGPLRKFPSRANGRYRAANANLRTVVQRIIDQHKAGDLESGGLLSMLLTASAQGGSRTLSDAEIYDQTVTMIVGGTDTTAAALAWACHLLAQYPDIQERLHAEAVAAFGSEPARWEHLPDLVLAERTVNEVLRMYPPIWLVTRMVTQNTILAGNSLSPGSTLIYSPYLLHHNPSVFPDPESFQPDRWDSDHRTLPRGSYLPFATGARKCIGDNFGFTEATLALATIARRWHLSEPRGSSPTRPVPGVTLGPASAPLVVRRYSNAPH